MALANNFDIVDNEYRQSTSQTNCHNYSMENYAIYI